MARLFRPTRPLLDRSGQPVIGPDGKPQRVPRTMNWFIRAYDSNGKAHDIATGTDKITEARRMKSDLESAAGKGEPIGNRVGKVTFDQAAVDIENDYIGNGRRTLDHLKRRIEKHLRPVFGGRRMSTITTADARAFIAARLEAGAKPAEVNNETAALRRMFALCVESGKLLHAPKVPRLKPNNTRKGFVERTMLDAILPHLPAFMRPMMLFAYYTGWRRNEILALQAPQVDLRAGVVRLNPGTTKNDEGREFHVRGDTGAVVLRELYDLLDERLQSIDALKAQGIITPYVFHQDDGSAVTSFPYDAWRKACEAAGYPGKIPHDFRRTAVRNLERAGVARSTAMKMVGHKTESIYRRYAIVDEQMHREAAAKLGAFASGTPETPPAQVRPFKRRARRL
jgi:integrase